MSTSSEDDRSPAHKRWAIPRHKERNRPCALPDVRQVEWRNLGQNGIFLIAIKTRGIERQGVKPPLHSLSTTG